MKKEVEVETTLYMLIDITKRPTGVKILAVAPIREISILGRLAKAEGKEVIGPALEGRGFSTLPQADLEYLFWNTFGKAPSDMYPQLIIDCLYHAKLIEVDKTDLRDLEARWEKVEAASTGETPTGRTPSEPKKKREPKEKKAPTEKKEKDPSGRPAATSTTGLVWLHCDKAYADMGGGNVDIKALSKAVKALCESDGINPGTTSVQFGKWKKAKLSA